MTSKSLKAIKENSAFAALYTEGMSALYRSGIFEFLRENGRIPPISPETPNYTEYTAALANWSVGYNTALDLLLNFRDLLEDTVDVNKAQADFGATDRALNNGDLTEEEADAIRSGKPIPTLKPTSNSNTTKS